MRTIALILGLFLARPASAALLYRFIPDTAAGTSLTAITGSEEYWTTITAGSMVATIQNWPAVGANSAQLDGSLNTFSWVCNTKTAYSNVTISTRIGTGMSQFGMWYGVPSGSGWTLQAGQGGYIANAGYFVRGIGTTWYLQKSNGTTLTTISTAAGTAPDGDDFIILYWVGSSHSATLNGVTLWSQVTDSTTSSGGLAMGGYSNGTNNFRALIVGDGLPTPTPSITPSFTPTSTNTSTATPTWSSTSTITPTFTATPTATPTNTITPTWTDTSTVTPTWTFTRTATPSSTQTITRTSTPSPTSTVTPTSVCTAVGDTTPETFGVYGVPMLSGNRYAFSAGRVNYIAAYISGTGSTIQGFIYTDSGNRPAAKVCQSTPLAAIAGWNYLPVTSSVTVTGSNYWVLVQSSSMSSRITGRQGEDLFVQRFPSTFGSAPASLTYTNGVTGAGIVYRNKYTYSAYAQVCSY